MATSVCLHVVLTRVLEHSINILLVRSFDSYYRRPTYTQQDAQTEDFFCGFDTEVRHKAFHSVHYESRHGGSRGTNACRATLDFGLKIIYKYCTAVSQGRHSLLLPMYPTSHSARFHKCVCFDGQWPPVARCLFTADICIVQHRPNQLCYVWPDGSVQFLRRYGLSPGSLRLQPPPDYRP
jgi:hypothetical protein